MFIFAMSESKRARLTREDVSGLPFHSFAVRTLMSHNY